MESHPKYIEAMLRIEQAKVKMKHQQDLCYAGKTDREGLIEAIQEGLDAAKNFARVVDEIKAEL